MINGKKRFIRDSEWKFSNKAKPISAGVVPLELQPRCPTGNGGMEPDLLSCALGSTDTCLCTVEDGTVCEGGIKGLPSEESGDRKGSLQNTGL